jgi:hypothetical protein
MKELCIYRLLFGRDDQQLAPDLDDVLSLPDLDDGTVATNSIAPIASPSTCQGPRVVAARIEWALLLRGGTMTPQPATRSNR